MKLKPLLTKYPVLSAFVITGLISMVVFVLVLLAAFEIILQFYPSHKVMPDGRILLFQPFAALAGGVLISAVVTIPLFIIGYGKLSRKFDRYQ